MKMLSSDKYCRITLLFSSERDLFQFMVVTKSPRFLVTKYALTLNGLFSLGDINAAKSKFHASVLEEIILH